MAIILGKHNKYCSQKNPKKPHKKTITNFSIENIFKQNQFDGHYQ